MRLFVLATLLVCFPALAQVQRNQPKAQAADDGDQVEEEGPFKILGEDPWIDAGIQAAAIFAAAAGSAAIAGGVLAFAASAAGYTSLGGVDIASVALLAVGGVAAFALPAGAILLASTLTGASWIRGVPAAVLAAFFGGAAILPGAIVGGIGGGAVFGILAINSDEGFDLIGGAAAPLVVGAALGAGFFGAIACMFGAGVGFAGGLTTDYILHDGFPEYNDQE